MKLKSRKKLGPSTTFYTGHDGKIPQGARPIRVSKHAKAKQSKLETTVNRILKDRYGLSGFTTKTAKP